MNANVRTRLAHPRNSGFRRLTSLDLMFLRFESAAWPCHFAGLAVVEGKALLDDSGKLRLGEITDRLNRRLARIPELRRRLYFPGVLRGGPLWVDDDRFDIRHHVRQAAVEAPGGDAQLLEAAARLDESQLDRIRPLWELWFLTGLRDGRIGVLLKLHHCVADGTAAVAVMGSLFDLEPDATDPVSAPWTPEPIPAAWSLLADNLSGKVRTVGRGAAALAHPIRLARAVSLFVMLARGTLGSKASPRTSLNQPVLAGRRVRFLRVSRSAMKEAGHAHHGTVNDVVLGLWSGGLRELLETRGELVAGLELAAGQAVSLRSGFDRTVGNQVGTIMLPLPVWEQDASRRLDLIVQRAHKPGARQQSAAIMGVLAGLSALPIARSGSRRQRAVNVRVTNVAGPPVPAYIFGARILEILPILRLFGNVGLALCAFSYAGQIYLVVTADAARFPDLDVLIEGMERDWQALVGDPVAEPVPA